LAHFGTILSQAIGGPGSRANQDGLRLHLVAPIGQRHLARAKEARRSRLESPWLKHHHGEHLAILITNRTSPHSTSLSALPVVVTLATTGAQHHLSEWHRLIIGLGHHASPALSIELKPKAL
jgi:hypothetical protein